MKNSNMKPLVTFALLVYNQRDFIRDAIHGAFSQDYENLEIVISDDCSTDDTFEIIKQEVANYAGPHKVLINRNEPNLGISAHFNKVVHELCHGDYIVVAAGDDVSLPARVSLSIDFMEKNPKMQSMTFTSEQVDKELNPLDSKWDTNLSPDEYSIFTLDDYCRFKDLIIFSGDSRTYRKSLIDYFPPLSDSKEEDLEFFIRSLLLGQVGVLRKPMVKRRVYGGNVSKKPMSRSNRNLQYMQLKKDVEFAFHHNAINELQYERMLRKIKIVKEFFYDNDDRARHHFLFYFFKGLVMVTQACSRFVCRL